MIKNGYIKLHRSITKWEWYDDPNTMRLFVHLLLTVSIETSNWHGEIIKRGSRVTSYGVLSEELNLSVMSIRTAIKHLISTGEITVKKTNKYSVITVNNFEKFQEVPSKITGDQHSGNNQPTFNQQQYKKVEEDSKKEKEKDSALAQMSEDELEALKARLRR